MSSCGSVGISTCNASEGSDSQKVKVGTWIGTAGGAFIALLIVAWLLRTFLNRRIRERFLNRLCQRKTQAARQRPPIHPSVSSRRSSAGRITNQKHIYYTSSLPPSYDEIMRKPSQYYIPTSPEGNINCPPQFYHPASPNGNSCISDRLPFWIPCSGFLPYRIHKYRGSISTLSISLPPIEEDVESSAPSTPTLGNSDHFTVANETGIGHHNSSLVEPTSFQVSQIEPEVALLLSTANTPCLKTDSICLQNKTTCLQANTTCLQANTACLQDNSTCLQDNTAFLHDNTTCLQANTTFLQPTSCNHKLNSSDANNNDVMNVKDTYSDDNIIKMSSADKIEMNR
ncbi:hypothetical protein Bpfe_026189 [Biomphalaria pfeifferi]|uniref:Uncharacterized protein n=1 Tax=Biomphalaria pfeifferi TaxID=112525 RepID=A0AAD8AZ66_BIOPF|nr:hypothetical protein Bpfe_026189 [Biomphalaria pfeifferi]